MSQIEDFRRLLSGLADAQSRAAALHLSAVTALLGAAIEMSCDALEALQQEAPRQNGRERPELGLRARPKPKFARCPPEAAACERRSPHETGGVAPP